LMVPPWVRIENSQYQQVRIAQSIFDMDLSSLSIPSLWLVLREINEKSLAKLMNTRFSDLVWCYDPSGMSHSLAPFKQSIRLMKTLRNRLRLRDQYLHILCSTKKGSESDRRVLTEITHRLGINTKIAEHLPQELHY